MNTKAKLYAGSVTGLVLVLLGVIIGGTFKGSTPKDIKNISEQFAGEAGNLLLEDYDPYTRYNGGLQTALDAIFSSTTITRFKLGQTGTSRTVALSGTCNWLFSGGGTNGLTFNASTTRNVDCTATGVQSGDLVFVTASSTPTAAGGGAVIIVSAAASTTANTISFVLWNGTGANATFNKDNASSTRYWILR